MNIPFPVLRRCLRATRIAPAAWEPVTGSPWLMPDFIGPSPR